MIDLINLHDYPRLLAALPRRISGRFLWVDDITYHVNEHGCAVLEGTWFGGDDSGKDAVPGGRVRIWYDELGIFQHRWAEGLGPDPFPQLDDVAGFIRDNRERITEALDSIEWAYCTCIYNYHRVVDDDFDLDERGEACALPEEGRPSWQDGCRWRCGKRSVRSLGEERIAEERKEANND